MKKQAPYDTKIDALCSNPDERINIIQNIILCDLDPPIAIALVADVVFPQE